VSKQPASKSKVKSTVEALPWAVLLRGGAIVGQRWAALSAKERAQFSQLVRESRGRVSNLSAKQRTELRKLAHKLDLKGMGRELVPLLRGGGRGGRRRAGKGR
jgi:hypothetical protein